MLHGENYFPQLIYEMCFKHAYSWLAACSRVQLLQLVIRQQDDWWKKTVHVKLLPEAFCL